MQRPRYEITHVIERFGQQFVEQCQPNSFILRTLDALRKCRTADLGGHEEKCDCCEKKRYSYNSCCNRHCPKCQASKQAFWVEDRMEEALDVKHFHIVFTVPEALNNICLLDSKHFYNSMFDCVWNTLYSFGYTHYGTETGAICVLHTWGQNLSLHPHIHCIVPAAGLTLDGKLKHISKKSKYLYNVKMLSYVFKGKFLSKIKSFLKQNNEISQHQQLLDDVYKKKWVVFCEPPLGSPAQIVKYLGQYTHRVAISNDRILEIDDNDVRFLFKDYSDNSRIKPAKLSGVEFLRRFCLHILPYRFVKIRYYGILSNKMKNFIGLIAPNKKANRAVESPQQRLKRLTGFDVYKCPFCKKGRMHIVNIIPRIRSPGNVLYNLQKNNFNV
jgi:hypothetical protein